MLKKATAIFLIILSSASLGSIAYEPKATGDSIDVIAEPEAIDIREYWLENPEECSRHIAISDMASTAGRICPEGASDRCLSAIMYIIFNRHRTLGFPDTISEVCTQPNQWDLRAEIYATPQLRKLAEKNLALWESGECCQLPCNRDSLYYEPTETGFWLRSCFDGAAEQFVPYFEDKEGVK